MSKSVLIVNTPDCCEDCLCLGGFTLTYTVCRVKARLIEDPYSKPEWCPLIPVSEEEKCEK